jgi:hypothetical protein
VSNPESLIQYNWKATWSGSWTFIPLAERESLLRLLETKCHSEQSLAKEHYWTRVPTKAEIEMTKKCIDCGGNFALPSLSRAPSNHHYPSHERSTPCHRFFERELNMPVSPSQKGFPGEYQ